jgi:anti-sigma regulatory factor (Ser/Thr protein kinase)
MQALLRHEALPYAGRDSFVSSCVTVANDALDHDERVVVMAESGKVDAVRDALGPVGGDVSFVHTDEHGRNPSRMITMLEGFQAAGGDRRSVGINESVFAARSPAALMEAQLAESVLNAAAVGHWPLSVVCLYDSTTLDDDCLTAMRRSHPVIRGEMDNHDYDPTLGETLFAGALAAVPGEVATLEVEGPDLAAMRQFVRATASGHGIPPDRVDDLVLAANEIVTNSVRHGGGRCTVTMWHDDEAVVCEVRDEGRITDPLLGRLAPSPTAAAGRGLWLANHLCDLVQLRSSDQGTVVRLFVERL